MESNDAKVHPGEENVKVFISTFLYNLDHRSGAQLGEAVAPPLVDNVGVPPPPLILAPLYGAEPLHAERPWRVEYKK